MPAPQEPQQQAPMEMTSDSAGVVTQQPTAEPQPDMSLRGDRVLPLRTSERASQHATAEPPFPERPAATPTITTALPMITLTRADNQPPPEASDEHPEPSPSSAKPGQIPASVQSSSRNDIALVELQPRPPVSKPITRRSKFVKDLTSHAEEGDGSAIGTGNEEVAHRDNDDNVEGDTLVEPAESDFADAVANKSGDGANNKDDNDKKPEENPNEELEESHNGKAWKGKAIATVSEEE
ncbi:hypothetical protein F4777DRAFT_599974 [Nemania sp. FL0916]|nr:hypothetical protein F4777DRAFT_599974 [Nemania sp. FL0916]